jgi:hypothetical protein
MFIFTLYKQETLSGFKNLTGLMRTYVLGLRPALFAAKRFIRKKCNFSIYPQVHYEQIFSTFPALEKYMQ